MTLPSISVKHPILILSIVFFIVFAGIESFRDLPVDLFPKADVPFVTISTFYPGAGPKDVESSITKPIEDELATLEGLKNIESTSQDSLSFLVLEFQMGAASPDVIEQRVRNRISLAKAKFPKEVEEPIIEKYNPSDQPILTLFVSSTSKSRPELSSWIDDDLKPSLARIPKVGRVSVLGDQKREIKIIGDHKKLENFRLPLLSVSKAIKNGGENVPGGSLESGGKEINLRTLGQFNHLSEVENTILSFENFEKPIRVKDIGRVVDSTEKERTRAFYGDKQGIAVQVYKQTGANTVEVTKQLKTEIEKINAASQKEQNTSLTIIQDGSKIIRDSISDVWESIAIGFVLTILVVYFFLGSFKSTVITGLAIPNSLLGAFLLMAIAGFSVNILTLLSLSLSVGLLIDDGIVVRENIFRYLELGAEPKKAAVVGAQEVTLAVLASTLAILSIFGPVGFLKGVTGQFFREFGLTVCFAMVISFFDGMAVAPMLSAFWSDKVQHVKKRSLNPFRIIVALFEKCQVYLEKIYKAIINKSLNFPILTVIIVFVFAIFIASPIKKLSSGFLPTDQSDEFNVQVNLPAGTNLEKTSSVAQKVDKLISTNPFIDYTFITVGNFKQEVFKATINVHLKMKLLRSKKLKPSQIRDDIKAEVAKITNLPADSEILVIPHDITASGQRAFNVILQSNNLDLLKEIANRVYAQVKNVKSLSGPSIDTKPGAEELQIDLKTDAAQKLGINTYTVGQEVRARVEGTEVGKLHDNGKETKVISTTDDPAPLWLKRKEEILVPNINLIPIDLRKVAEFKLTQGPSVLKRYNRSYAVRITADISTTGAGLSDALKQVTDIIKPELKNDSSLKFNFVGDSDSYKELSESMGKALLFGITFLFLVLASLYESFIISFLNIITLPLAVSGAFCALYLFHQDLNLYSMIGILLLLGVATKNSILLIDTAKENFKKEWDRHSIPEIKAVIENASSRRLRPILMTSLALIAGTVPVAVGLNEASAQRTSMGIAIIGGIITSTLFSLFLVPSLLILVERFRHFRLEFFKK